ncbi:MAG: 2-oxoacid:ferredoxin oxidoreductase subunit beta [Anaerolineaceae bacterium]|nr:2-oxoacid:ferredoxin oxidoreductase subunit beta [Anaerolineaceae bacterium]
MTATEHQASQNTNLVGLSRAEYRGAPSTLCQGCGHNGIAAQIVAACYEMNIVPENMVKFSGIGCSSKSPTYFLGRSFCFNGLHGRMPSLATGALFADKTLEAIGVSGDGDTASIGFGQFKHLIRRNLPLVYIIENNGVYGLTKGQFSATAEKGLELKRQGVNPFTPVDLAMEALISDATFVARSFAGDPKQVKEIIKAAIAHQGIAVIDIISPCVTFHNHENSFHSYSFGKSHEEPLHEITLVLARDEITVEDFESGTTREVTMYDGSTVMLKKLENEYNPTDKHQALRTLEEAAENNWLITGLIYVNPNVPTLFSKYNLPDTPLNRTPTSKLRPTAQSLEDLNQSMF